MEAREGIPATTCWVEESKQVRGRSLQKDGDSIHSDGKVHRANRHRSEVGMVVGLREVLFCADSANSAEQEAAASVEVLEVSQGALHLSVRLEGCYYCNDRIWGIWEVTNERYRGGTGGEPKN